MQFIISQFARIQKDENGSPIQIKPSEIYEFIETIKSIGDNINVSVPNEEEYNALILRIKSSPIFQVKRAAVKTAAAVGDVGKSIVSRGTNVVDSAKTSFSSAKNYCKLGFKEICTTVQTIKNTGSMFASDRPSGDRPRGGKTRKRNKKHLNKKNMKRK